MRKNEIINIVICYNNADEVIQYHQEIVNCQEGVSVGYIVVINKETNEKVHQIKEYSKGKNVYIYNPQKNLGYMNGLIYGYRKFREDTGEIPLYVIMSNTDIKFVHNKFFVVLQKKEYDDDVWCVGPSILVYEHGSYDNPVSIERYTSNYIKTLIRRFSTPLFREVYVILAFLKPRWVKKRREIKSRKVYEVHGCFFILTGEFAEHLKRKEYGALLYSEETFVAENVYIMNKVEYYDADLEIVHLEHSATSKLKPRQRAKHMEKSMKWIYNKYFLEGRETIINNRGKYTVVDDIDDSIERGGF